jgi:FixJ family two-component response regulator
LLDLYMPEMEGDQVVKALKRQGATLPVIVITGRAESAAGKRALKAGARMLLDKPFNEQVLLKSIDAVCETEVAPGEHGSFAGIYERS